MMKVVVSSRPFGESNSLPLQILKEAGLEVVLPPPGRAMKAEELKAALPGAKALIAGTSPLPAEVLDAGKDLVMIARLGIGLDNIHFPYMQKRNIFVTYTPDGPSLSVAELVMGQMLALARQTFEANERILKGEWKRLTGFTLQGRTLGILGLGRTGKLLSERAQSFGLRLLGTDIDPQQDFPKGVSGKKVSQEQLIRESDFISIHAPLSPLTRDLFNQKTFSQMKRGSYVINTARGEIVNLKDLEEALSTGQLLGAALDVYPQEPFSAQSLSQTLKEKVLFSAHMGSCTQEARLRMESEAAEAVVAFLVKGQKLREAPWNRESSLE